MDELKVLHCCWGDALDLGETGVVDSGDDCVGTGSAVFDRVRGCSFAPLALAAATWARRLTELVFRFRPGRVILVPLAVRVVVDPSGFLTWSKVSKGRLSETSRHRGTQKPCRTGGCQPTLIAPPAAFFLVTLATFSGSFGGMINLSQTMQ